MTNSKTSLKTPKSRDRDRDRDRDRKDEKASTQKSRAKGSRSPVNNENSMRSGNSSSRHKDEKTSRSWRNTSPDGSWRELETPTARHQDKPGDVKILKKEKNDRGRDDVQGAGASTSSA